MTEEQKRQEVADLLCKAARIIDTLKDDAERLRLFKGLTFPVSTETQVTNTLAPWIHTTTNPKRR